MLPIAVDNTFMTQFRSNALPDGIAWGPNNGNCGPTSLVNALRIVGLDIPGFHGERTQAVIDAARVLITGSNDPRCPTTKEQQAFALRAAGADVHPTRSLDAGLEAVRQGAAFVIGGNRAAPTWPRRDDDPAPVGIANHASVVARYDKEHNQYVVYDPALYAPVSVSRSQLLAFTQANSAAQMLRLGLIVQRSESPILSTA